MSIEINDEIHLTEIRSSDKAYLVEHLAEKEIYDRTLRIPYPYTEVEADKWLTIVAESTKLHGQPATWAIRNRTDNRSVVSDTTTSRSASHTAPKSAIG